MKIAHLCMTPIAGACWSWSEAFKEAGYDSFCCCGSVYGDGRIMPKDERWPPDERTIQRITECDLIFAHQGKPYRMKWYPRDKPTVAIYHSQPTMGHTDRRLEKDGWPWAAIGQWQARLYRGAVPVPNLLPLKHPWHIQQDKPTDRVRIVYSPSNKMLSGWDDKGYDLTASALANVDAESEIIMCKPLEYCLAAKAKAHIVIDEVTTGAYHRNSLEGLALGCRVVNACDGHCAELIEAMTGDARVPFDVTRPLNLVATLRSLVALGPERLAATGRSNALWMRIVWDPKRLIERNLAPLMDAALKRAA